MPYIHLTPQERYVISHLKSFKLSLREIARRLGRHHSSTSREIRRNGPKYPGGVYWYYFINPVVEQRRHQAKHHRRQSPPPLVRYLMASLLADRKAESFNAAAIPVYQGLPEYLRQTLTLDNGKEFSRFKELEAATGLKVYFADPYAAWQRGTNENTNGLLRFYFPKGTSFKRISESKLARAVQRLNSRPRKCLGYRTPQEVFDEACGGALAI